jgi:hypothetical protein
MVETYCRRPGRLGAEPTTLLTDFRFRTLVAGSENGTNPDVLCQEIVEEEPPSNGSAKSQPISVLGLLQRKIIDEH